MRGGRNKFGPMYKRDRARKLQVMRERQLSTSRPVSGGSGASGSGASAPAASPGHAGAMYADMGYSPSGGGGLYGVKHEIQIPQVSSLTSSPDSSPSPLTAASLAYPGQWLGSGAIPALPFCFSCISYFVRRPVAASVGQTSRDPFFSGKPASRIDWSAFN